MTMGPTPRPSITSRRPAFWPRRNIPKAWFIVLSHHQDAIALRGHRGYIDL